MTAPNSSDNLANLPMTLSKALASALLEYLNDRSARKTKRLLLHRYPKAILEHVCEDAIDALTLEKNTLLINGRPIQFALVQPPDEVDRLKTHRGYVYGCSPDWPVWARDRGGLLVVLCPPDWYESLHESIRSNSFLAFDEGRRPAAPRAILRRMIESAALDEPNYDLLWEIASLMLDEAQRKRHDNGAIQFLLAVEDYLKESDGLPTPSTLRTLGLIPDDRLIPGLDRSGIRKLVSANLAYQTNLSSELARSPLRYFQERFPNEADATVSEMLREHVAKFGYDLRLDDRKWIRDWPVDLTLERVTRPDQTVGSRMRSRATVRHLKIEGDFEVFDNVPVVHDNHIELTWDTFGSKDAREQDVSAYIDGSECPDSVVQLEEGRIHIDDVRPGRHSIEIRATDPERLEILGSKDSEVYVARDGYVPLSVLDQTSTQDGFEVRSGHDLQLAWHWSSNDAAVQQWFVRQLGESGTEVSFDPVESKMRTLRIPGGVAEPTDFQLTALNERGEILASAVLSVKPVLENESNDLPSGSVGQSLLDIARRLRADSARWSHLRTQPLKIDVEKISATQYWVRIIDNDQIVLERQYRIREARLLDRFEREFFITPDQPWILLTPAHSGPANPDKWPFERSSDFQLSRQRQDTIAAVPEFSDFLTKRRELFASMLGDHPDLQTLAGLPLASFRDKIVAYAESYERALAAVVKSGSEFNSHHVAMSLIDTIAFTAELPTSSAIDDTENICLFAVGPTHPLRLLWLLQFELAIRRAIEMGDDSDFAPRSFDGLSGVNYPPYLIDFARRFYRNIGVTPNYAWALYLPESEIESDIVLSPTLQRELSLRPNGDNVAVSADQIRNALDYYHEAHPFRDALRFHYIGAGSGEKIVEALESWLKTYGERPRTKNVADVTANRMRFHVNLLDVRDGEHLSGIGRAFEEYPERAGDDAELLERVVFSVQPVERSRFERIDTPLPELAKTHIIFGSEFFKTRGDAHLAEGRARSLAAWGLHNAPIKFIEWGNEQRLFVSSLVPKPLELAPDEAADKDIENLLHRLVYRFQVMSSISPDNRVYNENAARMQVIAIDRAALGAIQRMHKIAEWVYIADAHIDVELFDRPGQEGHYILDYRPTIGAIGRDDKRHNYVITTEDDAQIAGIIERLLQNEYASVFTGVEPTAIREVARLLLLTINRVSGRALLRILGRPAAVKGVVGMALAHQLYARLGLLAPVVHETSIHRIRLLIPIDDYFDIWYADRQELSRDTTTGVHADLLDVQVDLREEDAVIQIQMLEVKNRHSAYYGVNLDSAAQQVLATYDILRSVLFGVNGKGRRDEKIKLSEFARVIDFHLRRSFMQTLGDKPQAVEAARKFRGAIYEATISGKVHLKLGLRDTAGELSPGIVLHFASEPAFPAFDAHVSDCLSQVKLDDNNLPVRYMRLGFEDVACLLQGKTPTNYSDMRDVIDHAERLQSVLRGNAVITEQETVQAEILPTNAVSDQGIPPTKELSRSDMSDTQRELVERAQKTFEGFIGNEAARELLIPILVQGLSETPRHVPMNLVFVGPPSTGKTELAKRIAHTLNLPFLARSASSISRIDDLLEAMKRLAESERARLKEMSKISGRRVLRVPPMCVFIDELQALRGSIQDAALTMLEPSERRAEGAKTDYIADVSDVTFVCATTDFGALDRALRTRLFRIELRPYTMEEVAQIVELRYPGWAIDVYQRLAVVGRRTPRIALERAKSLSMHIKAYGDKDPVAALDRLCILLGIDALGVTDEDRRMLKALADSRQPLGVEYLASQLQISKDVVLDVIEPYLSELGFVARQPNGRIITGAGRRYLQTTTKK
jgi:Holliday junction DNA helicase RuvB